MFFLCPPNVTMFLQIEEHAVVQCVVPDWKPPALSAGQQLQSILVGDASAFSACQAKHRLASANTCCYCLSSICSPNCVQHFYVPTFLTSCINRGRTSTQPCSNPLWMCVCLLLQVFLRNTLCMKNIC